MNNTTALAVLLGLGVGCGLWLLISPARGVNASSNRRLSWPGSGNTPRDPRQNWRLGAAAAIGVLAGVGTGWMVGGILAGLACWAVPRIVGRDPGQAHRVERIEAIATWTEMLRDTLSAAAGLEQAILASAPLAPVAIGPEIGDLAARLEAGDRLAPALRRLADQLGDPTGDLVIAALVLAAEQQARQLGELLGSLAHAAREQASMRLRVEAGRARTRTSVRVIVGTTLGFAVTVVLVDRPYLTAYDSTTGQVVLLGIGVLFSVGFAWLLRIAAVTEPERFLSVTAEPSTYNTRDAGLVPERQV